MRIQQDSGFGKTQDSTGVGKIQDSAGFWIQHSAGLRISAGFRIQPDSTFSTEFSKIQDSARLSIQQDSEFRKIEDSAGFEIQ